MFILIAKREFPNVNPNLGFCVGKNPLLKSTQESLALKMTVSILFSALKWIWRKPRRDRESYFTLIPFLAIPTTTSNTSTVWRRHSVRSLHSYSSFEHSYPQALGLDPREPDPVYVTLREAARKRSDTGRKKRHLHHRRRCYSENGVTNTTNKMKNQQQLANGILFWRFMILLNRVGWCDFLTFYKVSDFCY